MAEVVAVIGVVASCIQIAATIEQISTFVRTNFHSHKAAKQELYPILDRLTAYKDVIEAIRDEAESEDPNSGCLQALKHVEEVLSTCEKSIEIVADRLCKLPKRVVIGKVLDQKSLKALEVFEDLKPLLVLALSADQRSISKAVEQHIQGARADILLLHQEQEKSFATVRTDLAKTHAFFWKDGIERERREVFEWLYAANHGAKIRVAQDCIQPGASNGKWLLQSRPFQSWKHGVCAPVLFLTGPSGSGKTVLSWMIIKALAAEQVHAMIPNDVPYLHELCLLDNQAANASLSDGQSVREGHDHNQDDTSAGDSDTLHEDSGHQSIRAETDSCVPIGSKLERELRLFRCPVIGCMKAYSSQTELHHHKSYGHSNCLLHDNGDGTLSIVNEDIQAPHSGAGGIETEKPHQCDVCLKRYKHLNALKYHSRHSPSCNHEILPLRPRGDIDETVSVTGKKIAFFIFDFGDPDKRTAEQMIRCLLLQLAAQNNLAYASVKALNVKQQNIPGFFLISMATWRNLFHDVLRTLRPRSWYFVVDGLDECTDFATLLDILAIEIAGNFQHWVLSSQYDYRLGAVSELQQNTIYLEGDELKEDIASYVSARLKADPGLRAYAPERKLMIQQAVMEKSHEMYRLASCQLDELSQLVDRRPTNIRSILANLPENLHIQYRRLVAAIEHKDQSMVFKLLNFVAFSARPVTVAELAEFAIFDPQVRQVDVEDRFDQPEDVLRICGNLARLSGERVVLAHKSVKDFLISEQCSGTSTTSTVTKLHHSICASCLAYLSLQALPTGEMLDDMHTAERHKRVRAFTRSMPLLDYACTMWPKHAAAAFPRRPDDDLDELLSLSSETSSWQVWLFQQRAVMWADQIQLAGYLYEAIITSRRLQGRASSWPVGFWQARRNFRQNPFPQRRRREAESSGQPPVDNRPPVGEISPAKASSTTADTLDKDFGRLSTDAALLEEFPNDITGCMEYHLVIVMLEVALQRALYDTAQTIYRQPVGRPIPERHLRKLLKEAESRMGPAYCDIIRQCQALVKNTSTEDRDESEDLSEHLSHMDNLKSLQALAAAGFRTAMLTDNSKTSVGSGSFARSPRKIVSISPSRAGREEEEEEEEEARLIHSSSSTSKTRPIPLKDKRIEESGAVAWSNTVFTRGPWGSGVSSNYLGNQFGGTFHQAGPGPVLEEAWMRDFFCCGLSLATLHDLLQHYEEAHAEKSNESKEQPSM